MMPQPCFERRAWDDKCLHCAAPEGAHTVSDDGPYLGRPFCPTVREGADYPLTLPHFLAAIASRQWAVVRFIQDGLELPDGVDAPASGPRHVDSRPHHPAYGGIAVPLDFLRGRTPVTDWTPNEKPPYELHEVGAILPISRLHILAPEQYTTTIYDFWGELVGRLYATALAWSEKKRGLTDAMPVAVDLSFDCALPGQDGLLYSAFQANTAVFRLMATLPSPISA